MKTLHQNMSLIRQHIAEAAAKAGRKPGEILLVAATKTVPAEDINEAIALGLTDAGENRVQEWQSKTELVNRAIRWHMIGQLQANKVKYIVPHMQLIHSLDRLSLAAEIDRVSLRCGVVTRCLVQVNLGQPDGRGGVTPAGLAPFMEQLSGFGNLCVQGLMVLPPPDEANARQYLAQGYELFHRCQKQNGDIQILSMGMSHDYYEAILEGATLVRIGSALFGKRG